ncbi:hypothetical protein C8F01DRAFT_666009 [Mycena amicta]|nr:hypothetical protein C8F01DRAFT_666009 [Mycena amicta]
MTAPSNSTSAHTDVLRSAQGVAATLKEIASLSPTPFLSTTASISQTVITHLQLLKSNKHGLVQMGQDIATILRGIVALEVTQSKETMLSPTLLYDIGHFTETLSKLQLWLESYQRASKLRRLFRQSEESAQLEACKRDIQHALDVFGKHAELTLSTGIEAMKRDAQAKHGELLKLVDADLDSDSTYSAPFSISSWAESTGSFSLLPSVPQLFNGREAQVSELVNLLLCGSARAAILGPGGMGKTSLAVAALHDAGVVQKYPNRYFIPCDSAFTAAQLTTIVATSLGLEPSLRRTKAIMNYLSERPPSLLVLDNFETPWEPPENRTAVEDFISLLSDIPHVALVVTMRGAERPTKVRWTRPFMPPLEPLTYEAARQTFVDITDDDHVDSEINELLALTDNVPLAVNLVARVAAVEGCMMTLERFKVERTAALVDGDDKRSNLETSIRISLSSPRMKSSPNAQELLSLVSLLPDGIFDADLLQSRLPIPEILHCKATLIRTSLAYSDPSGRLRVLAPIREYVQIVRPPAPPTLRRLRAHFHDLADLWYAFMHRRTLTTDLYPRLAMNMGNIHQLLLHGLDNDPLDLKVTVRTIMWLNYLNRMTSRGISPLLSRVPAVLPLVDDPSLSLYYYAEVLQSWEFVPVPDPDGVVATAMELLPGLGMPSIEARLYNAAAEYYLDCARDFDKAKKFFNRAFSSGLASDDLGPQARALGGLALIEWFYGNYNECIRIAGQQQRIGQMMGNTNAEIGGSRLRAMALTAIGKFPQSAQALAEGREAIVRSNMLNSQHDYMLMNTEADMHQVKTEYREAREIFSTIVQRTSAALSPSTYAYAVVNLAFVDVVTGGTSESILSHVETARETFRVSRDTRGLQIAEICHAYLSLRDGDKERARTELARLFGQVSADDDELSFMCLTRLADPVYRLYNLDEAVSWATVFLAFALRKNNRLAVHQALRCLGDLQDDDNDAINLLDTALDGFTAMDVHHSRAQCLDSLAKIDLRRGDRGKAEMLWATARPLFDRSQQTSDLERVDGLLKEFSD